MRKFLVDGTSHDSNFVINGLQLESADSVDSTMNVFTMLQAQNSCHDHLLLPVRTLFIHVKSPELAPVNLGPIEDLEIESVLHFDPMGDVGALDDGRVVAEPGLTQEDTFVNAKIAIVHCYYFISF